jgi:hypothetical protein
MPGGNRDLEEKIRLFTEFAALKSLLRREKRYYYKIPPTKGGGTKKEMLNPLHHIPR